MDFQAYAFRCGLGREGKLVQCLHWKVSAWLAHQSGSSVFPQEPCPLGIAALFFFSYSEVVDFYIHSVIMVVYYTG